MAEPASFAARLLVWWDTHGRKDLPWQREPSAWRVWVSEVMLQQTQVATVIPYFTRFIARFPDPAALAAAPLDEVLHLWTGLGYYARARNLKRAAELVVTRHGGELPRDATALEALPGIGRSTAAAILALAHGDRHAILDGNVKRVMARHRGVAGDPASAAILRTLWAAAEQATPHERVAPYTQAVMDLGATLCTRHAPRCADCPVAGDCVARATGRVAELPGRRTRRAQPLEQRRLLVVRAGSRVLLERRPESGVWGGLWSLPELVATEQPDTWVDRELGARITHSAPLPTIRHTFTHFRLEAEPIALWLAGAVRDLPPLRTWYDLTAPPRLGLPRPVLALLQRLAAQDT